MLAVVPQMAGLAQRGQVARSDVLRATVVHMRDRKHHPRPGAGVRLALNRIAPFTPPAGAHANPEADQWPFRRVAPLIFYADRHFIARVATSDGSSSQPRSVHTSADRWT